MSEGERESKRKRKRKGKKERERKKARESEREQEKESKKKQERAREREIVMESLKSHKSRMEPKTTGRVQIFSPPRSRLGLVRDKGLFARVSEGERQRAREEGEQHREVEQEKERG